jgi:hypothetical protein
MLAEAAGVELSTSTDNNEVIDSKDDKNDKNGTMSGLCTKCVQTPEK